MKDILQIGAAVNRMRERTVDLVAVQGGRYALNGQRPPAGGAFYTSKASAMREAHRRGFTHINDTTPGGSGRNRIPINYR